MFTAKPVSVLFDACAAVDKGGCGGIGCGCAGADTSLCAWETTLGHVMMWVLLIVLTGVYFMGHMAGC
jgi:hypothetical protein